ncbi:dihydrolipoyl dehydrogenase [Compostibacillus humi]|uniref:Dihydrolipoyl dehydrogenase n=1 Tax=Compostibacillus humi TaxID=1245525 RepID=A0A8J2ZQ86_9BACI|nr:dihydrolipoyl dehydrogenase [Compostibacillus humi]GGH69228.1 dihydrolipoyl dehydrogenase [Compostibacillus humi]
MAEEYDLVVLGGGTGGYVAAIRASQLGMKVAIVEKEKLGGTCLHRGCIPSKALLRSAEVYRLMKNSQQYGVEIENFRLDFAQVQKRKENIVNTLHQGVKSLMKKWKIDLYHGFGRILGPSIFSPLSGTISVEYEDGRENTMLVPKYVLIATGSRPSALPGLVPDGVNIVTSDHSLEWDNLPSSVLIIGGGVIGVEWASLLADFGVEVTVLEYAEQILPNMDDAVAKELTNQLKKKGIEIVTGAKVLPDASSSSGRMEITAELKDGERKMFQAEKILLAVGRSPNTENIGLENTDIELENGYIRTSEFYQTKESHIYAIGDCIGGLQLAHAASHEGIIAVEHMNNLTPESLSYENIPSCIYTDPEVASIGLSEKEAKERGMEVKVGKFPFQAIGKAHVHGDTEGFVKIIANKINDDIVGIHMVGPNVTELISEASLAKLLDATPWEISKTVHAHPTLAEIIGEAAMSVDGNQIHG